MTNSLSTHMCKSMRAAGLSKRREHVIENKLMNIIKSSGEEFAISYLKDLRDYHIARAGGEEFPTLSPWHRKDSKGAPSDWQKCFHFKRPKTSIQVISAAINSIELSHVSEKQYEKWISAVRTPINEMSPEPLLIGLNNHKERFDRRLAELIASQGLFQPSDLTGRIIPTYYGSVKISDDNGNTNIQSLMTAYSATINSAPAYAGFLELDNIRLVEKNYPDLVINQKEARIELAEHIVSAGNFLMTQEFEKSPDGTTHFGCNQLSGRIGFLQQPGGKLRTIANPNRYLQHVMRPLQKALSEEVNHRPNVCVLDQKDGLDYAEEYLHFLQSSPRHPGTLFSDKVFSSDLSSATDTLDVSRYLDQLDVLELSRANFDSFDLAARSDWYNPITDSEVSWTQGQPLGLAPSFAILTMMHDDIAFTAFCRSYSDVGSPEVFSGEEKLTVRKLASANYRIVGDDAFMGNGMKNRYISIMRSYDGRINEEKCLESDRAIEFCSQLVTSSTHYPIKPKIGKYYTSLYTDLEKSTFEKMLNADLIRKKDIADAKTLASFSSEDLDNLPSIKSNLSRPFIERYGASLALSQAALLNRREVELITLPAYSLNNQKERVPYVFSGDIPIEAFSDKDFRISVSPRVLTYNWKTDSYDVQLSSYRQAKELSKVLNSITSEVSYDKTTVLLTLPPPDQNPAQIPEVVVLADDKSVGIQLRTPKEIRKPLTFEKYVVLNNATEFSKGKSGVIEKEFGSCYYDVKLPSNDLPYGPSFLRSKLESYRSKYTEMLRTSSLERQDNSRGRSR